MSALAQQPSVNSSSRRLSEIEAIQEISWLASTALDLASGVRAVLETALRVRGIAQIILEPYGLLSASEFQLQWGSATGSGVQGSAVAQIAWGGGTSGEIRIRFDLRMNSLQSPLRFTRFIGQQLGGLLYQFDLLRRREFLARGNEALRRRIATPADERYGYASTPLAEKQEIGSRETSA